MRDWRIAVSAVVATTAVIGTAQAITDTAFNYSSPKNGWYTISPPDLVPDTHNLQYAIAVLSATTSNGGKLFAGIHLPQGAHIKNATMWYQSGSGASDIYFQIVRTSLETGSPNVLASGITDDDSDTRKRITVAFPAAMAKVENNAYRYTLEVGPGSSDNRFFALRIAYQYSTAGD